MLLFWLASTLVYRVYSNMSLSICSIPSSNSSMFSSRSSKYANSHWSTRLRDSCDGRRIRNFCSNGSLIIATIWLGGSIFSSTSIKPVTCSISSSVIEDLHCQCLHMQIIAIELTSEACDVWTSGKPDSWLLPVLAFNLLETLNGGCWVVRLIWPLCRCICWRSPSRCCHSRFGC